jgi:hypothetical protein
MLLRKQPTRPLWPPERNKNKPPRLVLGSRKQWLDSGVYFRETAPKKTAELLTPPHYFPAVTYSPMTPTATVPSALEGLTAVFGMGTGVSPPL